MTTETMQERGYLHRRSDDFGKVPEELMHDLNLTDGAVRLYAHMHWRYGSNCDDHEGRKSMGEMLGVGVSTISSRVKELVDANWVVVVARYNNKGRTTNFYHVFELQTDCIEWKRKHSLKNGASRNLEVPITDSTSRNLEGCIIQTQKIQDISDDISYVASNSVGEKQDATPSAPVSEKPVETPPPSATSTRKELTPGEAFQIMLNGMDDKDHLPAGFDFKPYMRLFKQLLKDGWTEDDFRRAGKIIRKWNDANGSPMYPAHVGDFIILIKEALGLVKRGFKSMQIADYVRAEKQQDFWRGKQMSLSYVAKNIKATAVPPVTETAEAMQKRINALPIPPSYVAPNHAL